MAKKGDPCSVCLVPLRRRSEIGICQRNPECRRAYGVAWYEANSDGVIARTSVWQKVNAEKINKRKREDRVKNPEKYRAWARGNKKRNPETYRAAQSRRRT